MLITKSSAQADRNIRTAVYVDHRLNTQAGMIDRIDVSIIYVLNVCIRRRVHGATRNLKVAYGRYK